LRVAILRSGGMGGAPLDNLHRSFAALFLYDDPRVELLMVDHRQVLPFNHLKSPDKESADANRINLLMMGHRRARDEQLELWDDVCLARAEFCGQIARWNNGVDAWVASESPRRQKQFINDLARAVQKAGLEAPPSNAVSFDDLFAILDGLGGSVSRSLRRIRTIALASRRRIRVVPSHYIPRYSRHGSGQAGGALAVA
jgi:hypothetical protein